LKKKNKESKDSSLDELRHSLLAKEQELQDIRKQLTDSKRETNNLTSKISMQDKELNYKKERISQQEKQLDEFSSRTTELQQQLEETSNSLMEAESNFKRQLELQKEAEAIAVQRSQEQKIVQPIPSKHSRKASVMSFLENLNPKQQAILPKKSTLASPKKEGALLKQGGGMRKKWEKRWIYLTDDYFYCFKDQQSQEPSKSFSSSDIMVAKAEERTKTKNTFSVARVTSGTVKKPMLLQAASETEMNEWIEAITSCQEQLLSKGSF